MFENNRREFLKTSIILALSSTYPSLLQGCFSQSTKSDVVYDPVIDSHSHIFNCRDLQQLSVLVFVFVAKYSEEMSLPDFLREIITELGTSIANTVEILFESLTPDYEKENKKLDKILANKKEFPDYDKSQTLEANRNIIFTSSSNILKLQFENKSDEERSDAEFLEEYKNAKNSLANLYIDLTKEEAGKARIYTAEEQLFLKDVNTISDYISARRKLLTIKKSQDLHKLDIQLYTQKYNELYQGWDRIIPEEEFEKIFIIEREVDIEKINSIASNIYDVLNLIDLFLTIISYIDFFKAAMSSHLSNSRTVYKLFNRTKTNSDYFITASVDMDYWVNSVSDDRNRKGNNNSIVQQYALIEKTSIVMKGTILPMVGFDPWREYSHRKSPLAEPVSPLDLLQDLILNHGFVGVKLYPPMGFKPYGNSAQENKWPRHAPNDKDPLFGEELDKILLKLFTFCVDNDVPVMAHASNSMYSQPGYGERGSAKEWKNLLTLNISGQLPFKNLRLNLGHAGDFQQITDRDSTWANNILELAASKEHPNVYMDFSYFSEIDNRSNRKKLISIVKDFKDVIKSKIMYGSDWWMLARYKYKNQYLSNMVIFANEVGDNFSKDFFYQNCINYLGFNDPMNNNRNRMQEFYIKHKIPLPRFIN